MIELTTESAARLAPESCMPGRMRIGTAGEYDRSKDGKPPIPFANAPSGPSPARATAAPSPFGVWSRPISAAAPAPVKRERR